MADATTHVLGPGNAELRVLTEREGLASRAGHDLVLVVGRWEATLVLGDDAGLELTADSRSLEIKSASGGVKPLSDKDRREIVKNIDTKVLHGAPIVFRANTITDQPGQGLTVAGDLTVGGTSKPTTFELRLSDDGALSARAVITQTAFDLKPYSGLMGTLKVADDVVIEVEGRLP
jgi:hypothetical protein